MEETQDAWGASKGADMSSNMLRTVCVTAGLLAITAGGLIGCERSPANREAERRQDAAQERARAEKKTIEDQADLEKKRIEDEKERMKREAELKKEQEERDAERMKDRNDPNYVPPATTPR
jgi:hypothetical protein